MVEPYYEQDGITIYHGRCEDILPTLPPVDLVLTDPPYGLGGRWQGKRDGVWKLDREDVMGWDAATVDVVLALPEIAPSCVIWGGNYYALPPVRGWLSWDKMQKHSGSDFEMAWTNLGIPTRTFRMCRAQAYRKGKVHPTQKPIELMAWCLGFTPNALTILDPFMGSGTTLIAAKQAGKCAIGIEISEAHCATAVARLSQAVLPMEMIAD